MEKVKNKKLGKRRNRNRYRSRVDGTADRPRLAVFRSLKHIYVQAIDDRNAITLAATSSRDPEFRKGKERGSNKEGARRIGEIIGEKLKEKGLQIAVFDRGGNQYHGRVRALAEGARSKGLKF